MSGKNGYLSGKYQGIFEEICLPDLADTLHFCRTYFDLASNHGSEKHDKNRNTVSNDNENKNDTRNSNNFRMYPCDCEHAFLDT